MPAKSDKLFHKRRALTKADLKRKKPAKETRKRILIVSEGEVTEPTYFEAFKVFYGLVNIDVCGRECDSSPTSVVGFAEKLTKQAGHYLSGGYDTVYCVIDRDEHTDFMSAISKIHSLNKSNRFLAREIKPIVSYPCFEVWLLFHFTYTRKPFVATGNKSAADIVASSLKSTTPEFATYQKTLTPDHCKLLLKLLQTALSNAFKAESDADRTEQKNPSTTIHQMIKEILH